MWIIELLDYVLMYHFMFSNCHFVGRLYVKLIDIQILCITPLVRRVAEWLLVGMYDKITREIEKKNRFMICIKC